MKKTELINLIQEEMNKASISKEAIEAIKAYSAMGSEQEDDYDLSDTDMFTLLDPLVNTNQVKILYRGFGIDEDELEDFMEYDWTNGSTNIEEGLMSWTDDKTRSHVYGSGEVHITYIFEIKSYLDITDYSIFDENEYLTSNLKWTPTDEPKMVRPGSWEVYGKEI